jgi:hypothetical protein
MILAKSLAPPDWAVALTQHAPDERMREATSCLPGTERGGSHQADQRLIWTIASQILLGPATYVPCMVAASLNAVAGFALMMAVAVYWALPYRVRPGPGRVA